MRWVTNREQSEYMRGLKNLNLKKTVKAEEWAESALRKTNHRWTRQAQWGCRIFDFWCAELGIAVEIDGDNHDAAYDAARDKYNYWRSGIIVIRVPNYDEVALNEALDVISRADTLADRKQKMRQQFGLAPTDSFKKIAKKVGLNLAHGDWEPR